MVVLRLSVVALALMNATAVYPQQPPARTEVPAQDPEKPPPGQAGQDPQAPVGAGTAETLKGLLQTIDARREELRAKQEQLRSARTQGNRETEAELQEELRTLQADIARLEVDFETLTTGVDVADFDRPAVRPFNLNEELELLLKPLVHELKEATEDPRQIERLRTDAAQHTQRARNAEQALRGLRQLRGQTSDPDITAKVDALIARWEQRKTDAENAQQIAEHQLESRLAQRKSILESTSNLFGNFFRTRGLNMLLALLAFLAVVSGLRFLSKPVRRAISRRRPDRSRVYARVFTVAFHTGVVGLATIAALLALYAAGDWVLLGLALLFFLGLAWASKNTLPRFLEQMRILLNLGAIREKERTVYNGLPWRVERLGIYTSLTNPVLSGGFVRLPIRALVDMTSRPCGERELWFPCQEEDWVVLSDGTRGKVLSQSPEMVQLVQLGGSLITYQTQAFLGMNPKNLSSNFRLSVTFGIDYRHQSISTLAIPKIMRDRLEGELSALIGEDNLMNLSVEFQSAGSSSLDYAAIADFRGAVAARSEQLQRAIQRILVDACNENGWTIPFTQVTLHQAG